jgi:PPM family protein phosphatase
LLHAAKSHIGLVRRMNQDNYAVLLELGMRQFFMIADGMGGPSAGEVASEIAADTVTHFVMESFQRGDNFEIEDMLREAIYAANQKIIACAMKTEAYQGMGTTLISALVDKSEVVFAHVGDSRGYLFQAQKLSQITHDHSLVAELVRRGQLTPEEAYHHPQRNIVTRSLGTESHSTPDLTVVPWSHGDVVLLCTDGLTDVVHLEELETFLAQVVQATCSEDVEEVAHQMIRLALERGGPDNITLILVLHTEGGEAA